MAEAPRSTGRREIRQGVISKGLATGAQLFQWLLLSLIVSIVVEWVGMVWWWPNEARTHSRDMLTAEIAYLEVDFRRSVIVSDPAQLASTIGDKTYHILFELTKIAVLIEWLSRPVKSDQHRTTRALRHGYQRVADFVVATIQITQVFSVRLAVLTLALPVFLLFGAVGFVDGLVQRDLRRWGGGRESSFVYHWVKRLVVPLLVTTWVIYLALPFRLHPTLIVLPFATMFGLSVAITSTTFKKYL